MEGAKHAVRPRAGEIHARALCHRDVKPSNFMITDAGVLKVGDFGQARPLVAKEGEKSDFSHQISTRWYRSPELLFGARSYTTAIDLWAVGVVLALAVGFVGARVGRGLKLLEDELTSTATAAARPAARCCARRRRCAASRRAVPPKRSTR